MATMIEYMKTLIFTQKVANATIPVKDKEKYNFTDYPDF